MKNSDLRKNRAFLIGEEPLLAIDDRIISYAGENNLKLTRNHHLWPERSLSWKSKGINKQIQIYLEKNGKDFMIWGSVHKDTMLGKRYLWKQEPKSIKIPLEWHKIELEVGILKDKLDKIGKSDLSPTK